VSAATSCNASLYDCTGIVAYPANAYVAQSSAQAVGVDQAGNVPPFPYALAIGYPGGNGICANGNF
jgi:hypothetical protein